MDDGTSSRFCNTKMGVDQGTLIYNHAIMGRISEYFFTKSFGRLDGNAYLCNRYKQFHYEQFKDYYNKESFQEIGREDICG